MSSKTWISIITSRDEAERLIKQAQIDENLCILNRLIIKGEIKDVFSNRILGKPGNNLAISTLTQGWSPMDSV